MGLSGRKVKQRIGNDPRNLSWADDAARFGSNYLSKFGWDATKGLGMSGDGRVSHVKVAQKLDMLGIGAAHQQDPNGLAWKQNKDFENLLRRLNQTEGDSKEDRLTVVVDGFVRPTEEDVKEKRDPDNEKVGAKEKKGKKRKHSGEKEKKKRKREEEVEETVKKSKNKKNDDKLSSASTTPSKSTLTSPEPAPPIEQKSTRVLPRHRSHRARHIAAKSLGSKSAAAISEILGIPITPSPYSSTVPSGTQTPQESKLTSVYDDNNEAPEVVMITTSTKSVQDYFKEKMGNLKGSGYSVPDKSRQLGTVEDDYDDVPRRGLGSLTKLKLDENGASNIGFSKISALVTKEEKGSSLHDKEEEEEERRRRKKEKKALKALRKERRS